MKKHYIINCYGKSMMEQKYEMADARITQIHRNQFLRMMQNEESFIFYVGGPWCKNCRALIPVLNEFLISHDVKEIYNLDPIKAIHKSRKADIRRCLTRASEYHWKEVSSYFDFDDIMENENGTKRVSVPFIVKVSNGKALAYYSKEYVKKDLTEETIKQIKKDLEVLL